MRIPAGASASADHRALLHAYLEHLRVRRYSEASVKMVHDWLPRFFAFLKKRRVRDLRAVREADLVAYLRNLREHRTRRGTALSPWSVLAGMRTVQGLFRFLLRRGTLLADPARAVVVPEPENLPNARLNETQLRRLIQAPERWTLQGRKETAMLELIYGSGLRIGECARADLADLDLRQRTLMVRNGKGRKDRVVPLSGRAVQALDVYLRDVRPSLAKDSREGALFLTQFGKRSGAPGMRLIMKKHGQALGFAVTPHQLRHACATHLLKGGASVRHVQEILGHRQLQTTARYTHVIPDELRRVLERAHPRERLWKRRAAR